MATVTKMKAAVNNKNLPILGEDGNLYSYYFGRYFNKIVEKDYTPSSSEITALEAFIQNGIDNGWIDIVKYFLPLLGDSSHLDAAAVPLIDVVGDYTMTEYDDTENFASSMVLDSNNKVKYFGYTGSGSFQALKTPCSFDDCGKGISFSGYMPYPVLRTDTVDRFAVLKKTTKQYFNVRYNYTTTRNQLSYLKNATDDSMMPINLPYPDSEKLSYLHDNEKALIVSCAMYKNSLGEYLRLKSYLDADGSSSFSNGGYDSPVSYPDYEDLEKMYFGAASSGQHTDQMFGCLAVLDAAKCTKTIMSAYNNAVFTLMAALGK